MDAPDTVTLGGRNVSRATAKAKGAATHKAMKSFFAMRGERPNAPDQ